MNKIIQEIKETSVSNTNVKLYNKYYIIETKYGLCKINKKTYGKHNITIQSALDKNSYFINQALEVHR